MSAGPIRVSAVVLRDPKGLVLTVRKHGTSRFMLPGGKPEAGETSRQTAARECREEVGIALDPAALVSWGEFSAAAANEPGRQVIGEVFVGPVVSEVSPAGEIAQVRWLDLRAALPGDLAPMLADQVIPAILAGQARGAGQWPRPSSQESA